MGYWFDSLVQPGPTDAVITDIRGHAVAMLRGRGPLPPLRIGRQPYGVLPVTSLAGWKPQGEPAGMVQLAEELRAPIPGGDGVAQRARRPRGPGPRTRACSTARPAPVSNTVGCARWSARTSHTAVVLLPGRRRRARAWPRRRTASATGAFGFRALGVNGLPLSRRARRQRPTRCRRSGCPTPSTGTRPTTGRRLAAVTPTSSACAAGALTVSGRRTRSFVLLDFIARRWWTPNAGGAGIT